MELLKKQIVLLTVFVAFSFAAYTQQNSEKSEIVKFIFATDVHLQFERNAPKGFRQAIAAMNAENPDFIIIGGDLINNAMGQNHALADSMAQLYQELIKEIEAPVYHVPGNHDFFGIYAASGADSTHFEFGEQFYENRFGESHYTFDYQGSRFFILNSVSTRKAGKYFGEIDSMQIQMIREKLQETDADMPLYIATHIPFITSFTQRYGGSTLATDSSMITVNSKEVLDLFKAHNLKAVFQGHLHIVEEIQIDNIRFITGGAVCGRWWTGARKGYKEGFILVKTNGESFEWEYLDFGWEAE